MASNQEFMSGNQNRNDDWNDCPQGELSQMVRKLDAAQSLTRTKKLVQTGFLSMLLVAGGVVAGGVLFTSNSMTYGGISCTECQGHFAEYHGHMTGSELLEDLGLVKSMDAHLAICQYCHDRFNENYPGVLSASISISTQHVIRSLPLLAVSRQPTFY